MLWLCDKYGQKLVKTNNVFAQQVILKDVDFSPWGFPKSHFFSYFCPLYRHIHIKKRFLFKLLTGKEFWYLHFICFFSFRMYIFPLWSYVTSTKFGVPFSEDWEYQMKVTYIHYTSNFIREWIVIWVNMNNNLLIKQLHQR